MKRPWIALCAVIAFLFCFFLASWLRASQQTARASITMTVSPSVLKISPTTIPGGQAGVVYSQQFTCSGGTAPYTFSSGGTLPPGLTLNSTTGLLSGTPTTAGSYTFTVSCTDSGN